MRRLGLLLACLLVSLVACGDDSAPNGGGEESQGDSGIAAVDEAIGEIESARIHLSLKAISPEDPPRGFEMSGVFAAPQSETELPLAELTYRNLLPTVTRETGFVSDGSRAWVITDQGHSELTGDKLEPLKGGADVAGVRKLAFSNWFSGEVQEQPGEQLDGIETVEYSGDVDGAVVLNDIIAMTGSLGANVEPPLDEEGLELVREAVQSPELVVLAGKEDRVPRRIKFSVGFPPGRIGDLGEALGRLYAQRLEFQIDLTEVNQPVTPPGAPTGPAAPTTTSTTPPDLPPPETIPDRV